MNQAVPKRLASSLIRRRSCQSAAGYCRAPILLLQIAVTRGILKRIGRCVRRRMLRRRWRKRSRSVGLSAMRFYLDVNVPADEQNDEQQPAPSVTVITIGTLVIDAAADAEHQDEHN